MRNSVAEAVGAILADEETRAAAMRNPDVKALIQIVSAQSMTGGPLDPARHRAVAHDTSSFPLFAA